MARVGSVQVLNWEDSVDPATEGQIYLSLLERVRQWEDQLLLLTTHELTQAELIDAVSSNYGIVTHEGLVAKDLKQFKAIAKKLKILLTKK